MAERLPRVTAAEVMRALQRGGWFIARQSGSHVILHHPERPGRITVAYHRAKTLKPKTLQAIMEQAGLTVEEFRRLL